MSFEDFIKGLIREVIEDPDIEITLESKLEEDLGLDSFSSLMIINGIEDEFQVNIDENVVREISTVSDIIEKFGDLYKNEKK